MKLKKDPLKFQKIKNIQKEALNQKGLYNSRTKVGILTMKKISKFSKTKHQTKKRPLKVPKNQKYI